MPPRKKRQPRCQKAPLLFHQQPLEGAKHHYGSQLPPVVTHTRQVPSKPIDHSTITSWISPQFDRAAESCFPAHQKQPCNPRQQSSRKVTTSKFPHLTFESPPPSSSSETLEIPFSKEPEKEASRRPLVPLLSPQSCGELSVNSLGSFPHVFLPPDIQTPDSSSTRGEPLSPMQKENRHPGLPLHLATPGSPEPGPVLVKDTPEEKYGLKVTWRRRRHLLAYLTERGKLSRSQFYVKN